MKRLSAERRCVAAEGLLCLTTACASYHVLFYQVRGLDSVWIGRILCANGVITLFAPLMWARLCQALGGVNAVLFVNVALTAALRFAAPFAPLRFAVPIMLAANACACAMLPLMDSILMTAEKREGIRYSTVRSAGAALQTIGIVLLGLVREDLMADWAFLLCSVLCVPALVAVRFLPRVRVSAAGGGWAIGELLRIPEFRAMLLAGIPIFHAIMATSDYALYVFSEARLDTKTLGLMYALRICMQIPGLMLERWLSRVMPRRAVLSLCAAMLAAECFLYRFVGQEWQMSALGAWFGLSYGLISAVMVRGAAIMVPERLLPSAQAMLLPALLAFGGLTDGLIGGAAVARVGATAYFTACGGLCLLAGGACALGTPRRPPGKANAG